MAEFDTGGMQGAQGGAGDQGAQQGLAPGVQGGAQTQGQQVSAGQAGSTDQLPEAYRGKSVQDVIRMHQEAERRLGQHGEELGKWRQFGNAWDPLLRQVGHDPRRLSAALEAASHRAYQSGQPQQGAQLHQQAQQAGRWAEQLDPDAQDKWLQQYTSSQVQPVQQQMQAGFQQLAAMGTEYINRMIDYAMRAIDAKFENPKLDIGAYLQEAVKYASGQYDPLDWAKHRLTAESPEAMQRRIETEVRQKVEQENRNRSMTTFVGAGGAPRALRPSTKTAPSAQKLADTPSMARAKEQFVNDWSKIAGSE